MNGSFGAITGRPYIRGRLVLPRLSLSDNISFCVDTGADQTVLMPGDGQVVKENAVRLITLSTRHAEESSTKHLSPHFPDEPRGRVVIGKNATHLSRIHEHHGQ